MLSHELEGASSLANYAGNSAGPLMVFMEFLPVRLNETIDDVFKNFLTA